MILSRSVPGSGDWRAQLAEVVLQLRQVQSAIQVAVAVLKAQRSDLDEDVASVLRYGGANRLEDQIERLLRLARP